MQVRIRLTYRSEMWSYQHRRRTKWGPTSYFYDVADDAFTRLLRPKGTQQYDGVLSNRPSSGRAHLVAVRRGLAGGVVTYSCRGVHFRLCEALLERILGGTPKNLHLRITSRREL